MSIKDATIEIILNLKNDVAELRTRARPQDDPEADVVLWKDNNDSDTLWVKQKEDGAWVLTLYKTYSQSRQLIHTYENITDMLFAPHNIWWHIKRELLQLDV